MEISSAKEIFADRQLKKISHDFKGQLSALNTPINAILFDTKIAAYLVDSSLPDYSLATLVSRYLGDFTLQVPAETTPYFINKLYRKFHQLLLENKLEELFYNVEMPLAYILYEMQNWGVSIDVCVMQKLSGDVETKLKSLKNEIFKISGKEFNLNSPKQLGVVLFEELKIKPLKKTKTGYSTAEDVLEKLSAKYEIAKLIIEYRELNKLQTTYINPFIEQVQRQGGKLHAEFNQTATSTGRLSSSSPNLQSIPAKGVFSFQLRKAFVPSFAHGFIVSADYSQIELRILAHFSKDERLKEAFSKNLDIHRYTAALLFAVKEEHVSEEQRNIAKRINFSIIYGMSSYGLSQELGIGNEEAEIFIQDYFSRYPGVKAYINSVYKEIEEKGFVTTILGRRRYLPDFRNPNPQLREFAQRQAVNSPIQGSCADLIKLAMVRIYREFTEKKMSSKLIMQIHDELVFDVQPDELDKLKEIVKRNMEQSIKLNVPIEVKIKVGKNWAQVA
jgi:DNA polymerase-1